MNLQEIKQYFCHLHDVKCNQKYNKTLPYSFHLEMVEKQYEKFQHLLNNYIKPDRHVPFTGYGSSDRELVYVGIFGHDSIEDARLTYNDIKDKFGEEIAEIVYLCTENKGRTRADRKNDVWYHELKTDKLAVFVKLCDIIANVKFSLLTNSSMFKKYKSEYNQKVKPMLYCEEYKEMFDYLDKILVIE